MDDFQSALDQLSLSCGDSETRLGDFAVVSQQELEKAGQSESLIEILENVAAAIPASSPKMESCSSFFVTYVVLH